MMQGAAGEESRKSAQTGSPRCPQRGSRPATFDRARDLSLRDRSGHSRDDEGWCARD